MGLRCLRIPAQLVTALHSSLEPASAQDVLDVKWVGNAP